MTKLDAMKAKLDVLRDMAQKAVEADDMESAEKHMSDVEALEKKVEIMEKLDKSEKAELLAEAEELTEPASVEKTASFFRAVFKTVAGKQLTPAEKALLTPDPVTATGDNGEGYILPKDISTKINELVREFRSFRGIVGTITTTALSGSMTIEDISGIAGLVNFTDGDELTESEDPQFKPVSFAMKEYGAIMYVSNVLIKMTDNDLLAYVAEYFAKKAVITENAKVVAALKYGKTAKSLSTWVALASSINVDLDPASLSRTVIVTNQSGFDYLDKQMDYNQRPILQPDPTNPTVKRFKGYPVIVFSNGQLVDDETYGSPVFYGNLQDGVKFVTCGYYRFATSTEAGFTRNTTAVRLIELFDVIQWDSSDECYCFGYLKAASENPSQG